MSDDRIPMTREGYEKLKAELDHMQNAEMIEITKRVATAREMGDLSENAEYHAAREDQGMLQARINELKDKLSRLVHHRPQPLPTDTVVFGTKVKVQDLDYRRRGRVRTRRPRRGRSGREQDPDHQPDRPGPHGQEGRRESRDPSAQRQDPFSGAGDRLTLRRRL